MSKYQKGLYSGLDKRMEQEGFRRWTLIPTTATEIMAGMVDFGKRYVPPSSKLLIDASQLNPKLRLNHFFVLYVNEKQAHGYSIPIELREDLERNYNVKDILLGKD